MTADDTLVTLSPSAEMTDILGELNAALERIKRAPRAAVRAYAFESLPVLEHARALLCWRESADADDRSASALLHHLSQELGIMSGMDLHERFRSLSEGRGIAHLWRNVQEAASLETLLKDEMALGWGGFETMPGEHSSERTVATRRRMMTDYYRNAVDWTMLRALDLTRAAALILDALDAEMISETQAGWWLTRVSTEAVVRAANWQEWAASLLMGRVFEALETSEEEAHEVIRLESAKLEALLAEAWRETPWPRLKSETAE